MWNMNLLKTKFKNLIQLYQKPFLHLLIFDTFLNDD